MEQLTFHLNHPNIDEQEPNEENRANQIVSYIREEFPDKRDILDLGTGRGIFISRAVAQGLNAYGVDLRDQKYQGDSQRFRNADARDLPFEDGEFDIVTAHHLLDQMLAQQKLPVREIRRVLSEAHRVLKPNGILIVLPYERLITEYDGFSLRERFFPNTAIYDRIPKT